MANQRTEIDFPCSSSFISYHFSWRRLLSSKTACTALWTSLITVTSLVMELSDWLMCFRMYSFEGNVCIAAPTACLISHVWYLARVELKYPVVMSWFKLSHYIQYDIIAGADKFPNGHPPTECAIVDGKVRVFHFRSIPPNYPRGGVSEGSMSVRRYIMIL